MKKNSVILFILWAVAVSVLTFVYLALMMNGYSVQSPDIGWILSFCVSGVTIAMMWLIRINAKAEKLTWLAIVSKILLIFYSVCTALGVLIFFLSRLFV